MDSRDDGRLAERPPSGGMRPRGGIYSQTGLSGPGPSGHTDLTPDTGIPSLGWFGIAAAIVVVAALIWQWFLL